MKAKHFECGYIAKAHGLRGEVVLRTHDRNSSAPFEVQHLWLRRPGHEEDVRFVIDEVRESKGSDVLVSLKGVTTREAAEGWVGATVLVARDELEPPEPGEVFQGDLLGLNVVTPEGKALGAVRQVLNAGPVPTLVIGEGRAEVMVPFAEEFVVRIDVDGGTMVLREPEIIE